MSGAHKYLPFVAIACLAAAAAVFVLASGAPSAQRTAGSVEFASPLEVYISASSTALSPGQPTTLTGSWSGGIAPYTVKWYSGTSQECAYDTNLLLTDTQVVGTSSLETVSPPLGGSYYCIVVTDSEVPPVSASSPTLGVTVSSATSTTVLPVTTAFSTATTVPASTTTVVSGTAGAIQSELCSLVHAVQSIIGIIALVLFLLGGLLYAISHFLPTNLEFKKSMTTWSTAMIVGGVIGLVLVLIAQPLISLIIGFGQTAGAGSVPLAAC
jgi:hypothetical protein